MNLIEFIILIVLIGVFFTMLWIAWHMVYIIYKYKTNGGMRCEKDERN